MPHKSRKHTDIKMPLHDFLSISPTELAQKKELIRAQQEKKSEVRSLNHQEQPARNTIRQEENTQRNTISATATEQHKKQAVIDAAVKKAGERAAAGMFAGKQANKPEAAAEPKSWFSWVMGR